MNRWLALSLSLVTLAFSADFASAQESYRPPVGGFADPAEAKPYRGELVFVDHINRRGSLRLHVDGHYHEGKLHHFAMLPYGVIRYRGAPAELKDIPIGTVLYGRFYLPPDPKTSIVPSSNGRDVTAPAETYAVLLEDGPSLALREGKAWTLSGVKVNGEAGELVAKLPRKEGGEGLGGEHTLTIDGSTRIWRGRELLGMQDLIDEGTWPKSGEMKLNGVAAQMSLAWHPRYLYQQFHVSDLWLDEAAMAVASERQRQRHRRHIRTRWMPAMVDSCDYGQFGKATVKATLLGGMDDSLYQEFKPGLRGKMAVAEDTLRTWWPDHDGMDGQITDVRQIDDGPVLGSSGIQITFDVPLILEGFRPGRLVRVRPQSWPNVKPPVEERVRGIHERWPSAEIFQKR